MPSNQTFFMLPCILHVWRSSVLQGGHALICQMTWMAWLARKLLSIHSFCADYFATARLFLLGIKKVSTNYVLCLLNLVKDNDLQKGWRGCVHRYILPCLSRPSIFSSLHNIARGPTTETPCSELVPAWGIRNLELSLTSRWRFGKHYSPSHQEGWIHLIFSRNFLLSFPGRVFRQHHLRFLIGSTSASFILQ